MAKKNDTKQSATKQSANKQSAAKKDTSKQSAGRGNRARASESERRDENPHVGVRAAAEVLGVSRSRVGQLRRDYESFPEPVVETASGPVWERSAIEEFSKVERKAGRKPGYSPLLGRVKGAGDE